MTTKPYTTRGWNRCDDCGKFDKPERLETYERRWLGLYGDLNEEEGFVHRNKCPRQNTLTESQEGE